MSEFEHGPAERARLRSEVALAGRILAPLWPLEGFIAVNPLGGLEDRPFEEAIALAGEVLGARGTLDESLFREAYAEGRVTAADLSRALGRRLPSLLEEPAVRLGESEYSAQEILLCDLRHGAPAPSPVRLARTRAERLVPAVAEAVDAQCAKWCGAFCDAGQSAWPMPGRERGFYLAWRDLAPRDRSLRRVERAALRDCLAECPEETVLAALDALGVPVDERRSYLQAHLACMPGWASHVRWRAEHAPGIDLVDYLAMRLAYESVLLDQGAARGGRAEVEDPQPDEDCSGAARARRIAEVMGANAVSGADLAAAAAALEYLPAHERGLVWLDAYESAYRDELLVSLAGGGAGDELQVPPAAQLVCCIDTRSEGLRRHLEELGDYETLGFAGFFAVAIRFQDLAGGAPSALCPVLLEPRNEVREFPADGAASLGERELAGRRALSGAEEAFHAAKDDLLSPFTLAEASGWAAGPIAAAKTVLAGPYGAVRQRLHREAAPPAPTVLNVQEAFSFQERALFAELALRMMGLTERFAPLVVLCAHGSSTENNPYAAALDCGACAGNRGGPNARTAAAILNGADVRRHLAARGIAIPDHTWFLAAEHDTANDCVTLLDPHLVPEGYRTDVEALGADLRRAGALLSRERCGSLPGAPTDPTPARARRHVRSRGRDWAQVFPEWGLAGNAAFIVGPRSLTRGVNLRCRAFLHSYEPAADPDGSALETILTAPLIVAQWINCQYYFSAVDPVVFGAGTKTIHNVIGSIGVLAGHNGDLQTGLPWQSLADGERLVHEPMRLLAVVQAPIERITRIIDRNTVLQRLFGNEWVALAARSGAGEPWLAHTTRGWEPWLTEEVRSL